MFRESYRNIFMSEFSFRTVSLLAVLVALPNLLGMLHYTTVFGLNVHFFQVAIFLAALVYGPWGGALSGALGSVYVAMAMHNPYIVVGNILLGFFVGLFAHRMKVHAVLAVLLAYAIQLPWLWLTDVYLVGMPMAAVNGVVVALLVSNVVWALAAHYSAKPLKRLVA